MIASTLVTAPLRKQLRGWVIGVLKRDGGPLIGYDVRKSDPRCARP